MDEQRAVYLRGLVANGRPVIGLEAPEDLAESYPLVFPLALPTVKGVVQVDVDGTLDFGAGLRQTIDGWYQDNVPASQSATVASRLSGTAQNAFIPVRAGSITGICIWSNAARSAGTLTAEVYVNGSATGLQAILNGTNTTFKATTQAGGIDVFNAGDRIDIRISTDGSWAPTTADVRATLEVEV